MVSVTRSSRKIKEVNDDSSKKEISYRKGSLRRSLRKTDVSGVMTSRETSFSRGISQSKQKSLSLDKPVSPSRPRITNKSERLEKQTPSPLRRSDRNKNMSSSSNSKQSVKEFTLSNLSRKKDSLIQVLVDAEKTESALESVGVRRKNMDARSFKSLFKRQHIKVVFPDVDGELEGQDNISYICNGNSRKSGCEPMRNGEDTSDKFSKRVVVKWRDESLNRASDEDLHKSICSLRGFDAEILGNDASIDSNHIDYVVDEIPELCHGDGLKDNRSNSSAIETYDYSEKLPTNYLTATNTISPAPQSSFCMESSQYCPISTESGEICLEMKVSEIVPSSSAKWETPRLLGTCVLCNKKKRVSHSSPEQELCSCSATLDDGLSNFSASKDGGDDGAAVPLKSFEHCCSRNPYKETNSLEEACVICDEVGGELLCCWGSGCSRCYHLSCLDPPLTCALPGVWHCPLCVYKKLALGVHSVSKGVESIWDVREVKATNAKGMHRQKQYFVKYHGLAHVHNHWVPDTQLCPENLSFFFNIIAKDQIVRWSSEWTVPHRLLRKRPVHKFEVSTSTDISESHYEWLVKWHGLNYEHSSWELDSACFLRSSLGQKLMSDYEIRLENAKKLNKHHKGSFVALPELAQGESLVNDRNLLKNVNDLRYCWFNCQNAVVFDNQDRAITMILFIQSMTAMCQPFLIIASSESFSLWEAEFARLAPSVDVAIYGGNKEIRKGIRASEFYEGGYVMFQVLLSSSQAVLEDLDMLQCIRWKAIVIDDYQHSMVPNTLKPIKTLASDLRVFLIIDRKEDMKSEYLNLLPWLDSHNDFHKVRCLNFYKDVDSCKLEKLLCCTSIESTSEVSKFVEYWVPVQISNYQLEQYCDALLNSNALRSSSRSDLVGALRDILLTVQKCCDHPYLVDTSIQKALFAEQHPVAEILEIGIKSSGKLHVLDSMLSEIKIRGLRVVILYQMIVGPEGATIGDILDDFLRQRFGENTYERVDARVTRSRKQSAMDRFNKRETGQFVFLLENRACSSSIKLSSLDLIIIYDCDWNPANDLRALQKISIDSKAEQIKVFRLYSSCTVEERALVLAKQKPNLDTSLQNLSLAGRVTYDTLLMWGASYLFSKLDEYHAVSSSIDLRGLSGQLLLNEVIMEFHAIVSDNCEIFYINPLISKVTLHDGYYKSNSRNFGEAKIQLMDGVEPYIFWRNLLDVKNPQWKHLKGPCPQNRKRVQCLVEPPRTFGCENSDDSKKRKQAVNDKVDPSSAQGDLSEYPITQIAGYKAANYITVASNQFQTLPTYNSTTNNNPNCMFGQSSFPAGVDTFESEERILLIHRQKRLHSFLQGEMTRICQLLKISVDVTETTRRFLEYVINNHDARSDSPAIMQAFQLSLCWVAALISQQKVDKKHSFLLAKQHLNYECTEEQVNSVYSKMHSLIWMYLQRSENANDSRKNCLLADEVINIEPSNISEGLPLNSSSCKLKKVKIDIEEELFEEHHAAQISLDEKLERMVKAAGNEIQHEMKKKLRKCEKLMKKLNRKQEEEVRELNRTLDEQRVKLEENHKLESAVIRSIHDQGSVAIFKLKILDDNFARKLEEHTLLKDMQLKNLKARHLAAWEEESQKEANWLAEAIACSSELRIIKGPQNLGSQSNGDAGCSQRNYVSPSDPSTSALAVTLGCNDPSATLCNLESVNSDNEVGIMSLERLPPVADKQLNHLIHSNDATRETGSANLPVSGELVSCEIQLEEQNKEASNEFLRNVSDKVVRHFDDVVLRNASTEGDLTGLPDSVVNQIDRPDDMTDSGLLLNHVCAFSLDKVPEDEIHQHLVSTEVQDREPAVELPSTLQIDVATLKLVDTAMVFQSNHEEFTTGNHELLHAIVVDASLSCDQSHLTETEHPIQNKKRSPSQSAGAGETEELFDVFISQSCEPSQLHDGHLDLGPSSRINSDQSIEMFAKSPNNTAIVGAVVSTAELPNQAVQLRLDSSQLHGPKNLLVHPIQQVASWNSNPSSLGEPLEDEVERLRKEAEQLEKTHEDVMSQLRSDCEKEMEEIIAQIRSKYEAKIKDAEAEFRLKKNEVEKNRNIVLMNKKLAEAFRSKYVDLKASSHPGSQQAFPSGFMPLPSTRLPSADSASRPPGQQTAAPFQQGMQLQKPIPNSLSSPVASQNVTAPPPLQAVPRTGPQISGCSSRSSDISGITSAINLRVGRERYSPAPHLQSFTPTVPPLVGGQIRSPVSHLHPFRSAAPPHVGGETHSHGSHIQPFRPVAPTSTAHHKKLPKRKYRRLDELP
ncbi:uncharacterized protein [Primulina huaijiensis]|uniref:uncharacterized protein isoform X3 n=1 Tax=Primulina huaijiensis TaxID=1492673 RepID=UPI003CC78DEA